MPDVKLKLGYKEKENTGWDGRYYDVAIVFQVEYAPCFTTKSGWNININNCPEIDRNKRILWLRGSDHARDNELLNASEQTLNEIARAVAEYNGRKNVVRIDSSGVIY